jgi:hypothetical protein
MILNVGMDIMKLLMCISIGCKPRVLSLVGMEISGVDERPWTEPMGQLLLLEAQDSMWKKGCPYEKVPRAFA